MYSLTSKSLINQQKSWTREILEEVNKKPVLTSQNYDYSNELENSILSLVDNDELFKKYSKMYDELNLKINELMNRNAHLETKIKKLENFIESKISSLEENVDKSVNNLIQHNNKFKERLQQLEVKHSIHSLTDLESEIGHKLEIPYNLSSEFSDCTEEQIKTDDRVLTYNFTPFFAKREYTNVNKNKSSLNGKLLKMVVEINGRIDEEPIIFPFGNNHIDEIFTEQELEMEFECSNQYNSGIARGIFNRNEYDYYVIYITEFVVDGNSSKLDAYDLPIVIKFDGILI